MNFDTNNRHMKTYRLGNTITIRWTISLANGEPFTLNPETVELVAIAPHHSMIIDDFTVESNVLTWIFKGSEQKYLGPYTLTLIQNRGKVDMVTVDICEAFALVPWSCMAGGTDASGVETESLEISSTVSATQVTLSPEVEAAIKTATDPKQDKEDPTLQTQDKTIPGSINEIAKDVYREKAIDEDVIIKEIDGKNGYYNNVSGNWVEDDNRRSTEKIDVQPGEKYLVTVNIGSSSALAPLPQWNNDTYVGIAEGFEKDSGNAVDREYIVPEGVNKIAIGSYTTVKPSLKKVIKESSFYTRNESDSKFQSVTDGSLQTTTDNVPQAINENFEKTEPLTSLLKRTENIYNKINSLTDIKLYWKSTEKKFVEKASWEPYIYIIKILDSVKVSDKYAFKVFNEHSFEEDNIVILTMINSNGPAAIDTVGIISSNNKTEKRGYFDSCAYDGYLYLYVEFDVSSDTSTHEAIIKTIMGNLVVIEGDPFTVGYPPKYIPHYKSVDVPSDLKAEADSDKIKLSLVDKDGNKIGDGIELNVSGGTSEDIEPTKINVVESITYKLEPSVLSDNNVILGTGWSGNLSEGFTHTSENTEPLQFSLPGISAEDRLIITFDSTGVIGESTDILVSIGDSATIKTYNGKSSFEIGAIYQNGNLMLTPASGFNGIVTNLKCRKISDSGTENITMRVDDVFCVQNSLVAGFWNIIIGSKSSTMSKMMYGTRNVSLGHASLNSMQVGNRNVAIGTFSMPFLTRGENNVAIGSDTIYPLVEADNCVGIGKQTLGGNKTAKDCIAVGMGALGNYSFSKDRTKCVGVGVNAGPSASENCTHIGYRAGANVLGANNTSIGYNAMAVGERSTADITGTELTCIGYKSEIANTPEAKAAVNSTAIGANTTITKSNQVVIGNSAVQEVLIAGKKIIFHEDGTVTWEVVS